MVLRTWARLSARSKPQTGARSLLPCGVTATGSPSWGFTERPAVGSNGGRTKISIGGSGFAWSPTTGPDTGDPTVGAGGAVVEEVDDVLLLADHLGFEHFGITGASGGGHHALACAALLPDRVVRATCTVGPAPLGPPGLEQEAWLAGQDPGNVKEFAWALAGEDVLYPALAVNWRTWRREWRSTRQQSSATSS
jgi:pimeloyl-ACP methyl ester carboxylesterase